MTAQALDAGFSESARREVAQVWDALPEHPFVRGMADGTLPPRVYRHYVTQNLLYLPHYARAIAMAVAKARDDAELRRYADALANIVDVEIPQNRRLLDRVRDLCDEGDEGGEGAVAMAAGTRNYTSYLLGVAGRCDVVAIGAAILPCAWSYGEIARRHASGVVEHPVYAEWVRFFATPEYAALVAGMRERLDADVAPLPPADVQRLSRIFADATRLEGEFWDMAMDAADPPAISG
ncbi:thiaminase II [Nocardioides carbamazepini]|uniref:thiaminase II n=1 Tax=Nocardioides carbamazepini TaxID=2854259 RepID=UPI002149CB52|nr:thiaminase II [Nocardioides carbamazepini]MCR1784770.1 thiaminase II [Nocardioides carbamazepini]